MWENIKKWWERYQDASEVRKAEFRFIAILKGFSQGVWAKDNKSALIVYNRVRDRYHELYREYYNKWGKRPRVEQKLLMDPLK